MCVDEWRLKIILSLCFIIFLYQIICKVNEKKNTVFGQPDADSGAG